MPPALDAGDSALTPFAQPQVELRCQTSKVAVVQLPTEQAGGIVTGNCGGKQLPENREASLSPTQLQQAEAIVHTATTALLSANSAESGQDQLQS